MAVGRPHGGRTGVLVVALGVLVVAPTVAAVDDPPFLGAKDLGPGWTALECTTEPTDACFYSHSDATLVLSAYPLGEQVPGQFVDVVVGTECAGVSPIDVGDLPLTGGCRTEAEGIGPYVLLAFGNDVWTYTATMTLSAEPPWDPAAFLLGVRAAQLAIAGGEPEPAETPAPEVPPSPLDRYLPDPGPPGFSPPGGASFDFDAFDTVAADEVGQLPRSDLDFLDDRTTGRARLWTGPEDLLVVVVVSEYPYEVVAGLSLDFDRTVNDERIAVPVAATIDDIQAVEIVAGEPPMTTLYIGFRRGAVAVDVAVAGGDRAAREDVASAMALDIDGRLPATGATAPIRPPTRWMSLAQAAAFTGLIVGLAVLVRRLLGGRARRMATIGGPAPLVDDVSGDARTIRRRGRKLTAIQVVAFVIVVVGLVADIGWWSLLVSGVGLVGGLTATMVMRRRELAGAFRYRLATGPRAIVYAGLAAALLVGGVVAAVRGTRESVLVPALSHLRLAERFSVSPWRLAGLMVVVGLGALILGAMWMRRARAWSRAARSWRGDPRPPILYLRSFGDDDLTVPSVNSARRPFLELFNLRGRDAFEEGIVWELADHGPVQAIGEPGRATAGLGAVRDVLDPAAWRDIVADRMRDAGAIVLAIGATPSVSWEVEQIVRAGHLGKTVFVVPPALPEEVGRRWALTSEAIHRAAGRLVVPPVGVAGALTAQLEPDRHHVRVTWADRLDEAAYRAAIERAFRHLDRVTVST